jgi:hypothetical protein
MTDLAVTVNSAQMKQIHAALAAIGRHLAQLHKEGGVANQTTVAIIGTNLAAIQSSLTNVPRVTSN